MLSGPAHPYHDRFNPAWGLNIGYDDLKVIEAYNFLTSIHTGKQLEPSFKAAYEVAQVEKTVIRSWESDKWEMVNY